MCLRDLSNLVDMLVNQNQQFLSLCSPSKVSQYSLLSSHHKKFFFFFFLSLSEVTKLPQHKRVLEPDWLYLPGGSGILEAVARDSGIGFPGEKSQLVEREREKQHGETGTSQRADRALSYCHLRADWWMLTRFWPSSAARKGRYR